MARASSCPPFVPIDLGKKAKIENFDFPAGDPTARTRRPGGGIGWCGCWPAEFGGGAPGGGVGPPGEAFWGETFSVFPAGDLTIDSGALVGEGQERFAEF